MIYVVASHEGFAEWMARNEMKDAIHIRTVSKARATTPAVTDEIHLAYGGDTEAYGILAHNRARMA